MNSNITAFNTVNQTLQSRNITVDRAAETTKRLTRENHNFRDEDF